MPEHDTTHAADDLARAAALGTAVRDNSRWFVRYQLAYGAAAGVAVAAIGLLAGNVVAVLAVTAVWLAVILILSGYAMRQPVLRRGFGRRHGIMIFAWAVIFQVVLFGGVYRFQDNLAWWLVGAVAVALPGLVGAYVEARR